jgi:hypothetical protein
MFYPLITINMLLRHRQCRRNEQQNQPRFTIHFFVAVPEGPYSVYRKPKNGLGHHDGDKGSRVVWWISRLDGTGLPTQVEAWKRYQQQSEFRKGGRET